MNDSDECLSPLGQTSDILRILPNEDTIDLRLFTDWSLVETYFQNGRVVMTAPQILVNDSLVEYSH